MSDQHPTSLAVSQSGALARSRDGARKRKRPRGGLRQLTSVGVQGVAVPEMRADLSQPADRSWLQIGWSCGGQKPSWLASSSKGVGEPRQKGSEKANASEPLRKGRKSIQKVSKPGHQLGSGSSAVGGLFATGMTQLPGTRHHARVDVPSAACLRPA